MDSASRSAVSDGAGLSAGAGADLAEEEPPAPGAPARAPRNPMSKILEVKKPAPVVILTSKPVFSHLHKKREKSDGGDADA